MPAIPQEDAQAAAVRSLRIALAGNPNTGKSSLFNVLTGMSQKTGNFPGVTVEKRTGIMKSWPERSGLPPVRAEIIDLPGAYSLTPESPDERIPVEMLVNKAHPLHPDLAVLTADASTLKRSLLLCTQVIDLGLPCVLALHMNDTAAAKGIAIAADKLSAALGIPVVKVNPRTGEGMQRLREAIAWTDRPALKRTIGGGPAPEMSGSEQAVFRYRAIDRILADCVTLTPATRKGVITGRLDAVLTHPILGYVVCAAILMLMFQAIFSLAAYPMTAIESGFSALSLWLSGVLPQTMLSSLLVDGVLAGLSGVVVFIPQIALLFGFITVLEDTGYMARVSFIMDRLMRNAGLNGRSVIPIISGVACAVPAIMAARTIGNRRERLITILVVPLTTCSARLPVYTLLIALVIPADAKLWIFGLQGLTFFALYTLGFVTAITAAWVIKLFIATGGKSYFIMEMPEYRLPLWKNALLAMYDRARVFVTEAGKIIIGIAIVLWFLSSYGPGGADGGFVQEKPALESSYAGYLGKAIEPAIEPLGFDWKIGIALITSFAAREVFVGTMATLYSVGDAGDHRSIREKMAGERHAVTGKPKYPPATGLSLMIFYAFAMQCMSTLAVVRRETGTWKWPAIQAVYMTLLAYASSYAVYQFFS